MNKSLKLVLVLLFAVCFPAFGATPKAHRYLSDQIENLPPFNGVSVQGKAKVVFVQDKNPALLLSGKADLVAKVNVYVEEGILNISYPSSFSLTDKQRVYITLTAPEINIVSVDEKSSFEVQGMLVANNIIFQAKQQGEIDVYHLQADNVEIKATGKSSVDLEQINTQSVKVTAFDKAEVDLSGKTQQAVFLQNGTDEIDADDLYAASVEAAVYGHGKITAYAQQALKANVQGRGKITYKGNPAQIDLEGNTKKIIPENKD